MESEKKIKEELTELLKTKTAVLMVGSGSSSMVGYPGWEQLVIKLRDKFYSEFQDLGTSGLGLAYSAQIIKKKAFDDEKIDQYHRFLSNLFQPDVNSQNCENFHISLVKLGFCGIVTTNYDLVLEIALKSAFPNLDHCRHIDLCSERSYLVLPFLRSLTPENKHHLLLHLHGCFDAPENLILTHDDYRRKYGLLGEKDDGKQNNKGLDSLHRKIIWGLLSFHPLVFVGFSLKDPFFLEMIRLVQADFKMEGENIHYAIMGYLLDEDKRETQDILMDLGISPLFYQIIENPDQTRDYGRLKDLIRQIENDLIQFSPDQLPPEDTSGHSESDTNVTDIVAPFLTLDKMNEITGGD